MTAPHAIALPAGGAQTGFPACGSEWPSTQSKSYPRTRFAPELCRSLQPVARIERSEIRERMSGFNASPGFHCV